MKKYLLLFVLFGFSLVYSQQTVNYDSLRNKITVKFSGDSKIEVGNFYTGLEFHHSSPLPQRISFYYPVANSIDLSNDYWTRDSTYVMALGLDVDGRKEWLGHEIYSYTLTPYSVTFTKTDEEKEINISYVFCKDKPAYVMEINIKNISGQKKNFKLLTNLETSLKTCHTYKLVDKAQTEYDNAGNSIFADFNDFGTYYASVFTANAGEKPSAFSSVSLIPKLPVVVNEWWNDSFWSFDKSNNSPGTEVTPAARFLYEKDLNPGESLNIVQVTGSTTKNEVKETVSYLVKNYMDEVSSFEKYVLDYAASNNVVTGDKILDNSVLWAKGVLAVNQHYIDGSIQPMPCPAEYNFYFTHDVLLTGLAVVNFDTDRVKNNLEFIIKHADKDKVIPHAYYWKDSAFVTEVAPPDNWNHFWFLILSGSYARHTHDKEFLGKLYPYLQKSLADALLNKKDDLMYAFRPDWWDIGRNFGPRSYITTLMVKSIREFLFVSKELGKDGSELQKYESYADELTAGLNSKLWDNDKKYFMNYFEDGSMDEHYYIGSLLSAHYNLIDSVRAGELANTASKYLLDPKIGIYAAYPMDFQNLGEYLKLVGNEAGAPHKYINGGVWQHGNAWYALALIKAGKRQEAIDFIKTTMTMDGIINSPNGQPAMYEYRDSNKDVAADYGEIDKPQFMWAAGWYLYCLYELY